MNKFIQKFKIIILALGIILGNNCVASQTALDSASNDSSVARINLCKSEFTKLLSGFEALEGYFNNDDKKNLSWLKYFFNSMLENNEDLIHLFKAFRRACVKIEILTVQQQTQNTSFLVENAINDLMAEKIKLQVLHDLCYQFNHEISDKDLTKIVLRALPEQFRFSFVANILRWFNKKSRDLSWLYSFLNQDFYSENIAIAEQVIDLISEYKSFVLCNKEVNFATFNAQADALINQLFGIQTKNYYMHNVIELLIAKLIYIKNQAQALAKPQAENLKFEQIKLFAQFKTLIQNTQFKTFRLNKNFGQIFDLFVSKMQKFFALKDLKLANLAELFELEQEIKTLREQNLPQEPGKIFKLLEIFGSGFKKQNLIIILDEMLIILSGATNQINKADSQDGRGILSDGLTLITQLRDAGFDATMLKDLAGAFFNQKFNSTQDALAFIAAKTGPVWIKKVLPFLPANIKGAISPFVNILAASQPGTDSLFEMLGQGKELLAKLSEDTKN